jgi:hypothetical protein
MLAEVAEAEAPTATVLLEVLEDPVGAVKEGGMPEMLSPLKEPTVEAEAEDLPTDITMLVALMGIQMVVGAVTE